MAEAVVHQLEVVQVQKEHRDALLAPAHASQGVLEAVHKQRPVGQIGQGVVERLVPELLFELFALGDITGTDHYSPDVRVVKELADRVFEIAPGAVFVRGPELYGRMESRCT